MGAALEKRRTIAAAEQIYSQLQLARFTSVARSQPVFANNNRTDQFRLVRDLRANITATGQLTYFPTPGFGWTGEISYIGLGTRDGCSLVVDNNDVFNQNACAAIDRRDRAASAVTASAGVVLRASTRGDIQPYVRANVGLALVPRSTTSMVLALGSA